MGAVLHFSDELEFKFRMAPTRYGIDSSQLSGTFYYVFF